MGAQRVEGPDAAVARIAAAQHGVVSIEQLRRAGIGRGGVSRRVAAGRLHRIHRGIYAVGHPGLSIEARWIAAVIAGGPGAALSHRSAAELWRMLERRPGPIHVTVPVAGGRASRAGVRLHRRPSLTRRETTVERGIAVTNPTRTLLDLRGAVSPGELRRAIREAEFRRLPVEPEALPSDRAGNKLELRLLQLCRRGGLPEPEANARVSGFEVDFLWRDSRLVVETDGYDAHAGRQAFEDDRRRDARLVADGYRVLRFTYRRVVSDPDAVLATIRAALRSRSTP